VHYANHLYDLDDRHLEDCHRLLATRAVDWAVIEARARRAQLRLPVTLLVEALRARGTRVPALRMERGWGLLRLRRRLAGRWVTTSPRLGLRRPRSRAFAYLLLRPLLSDRATALPRVAASFGLPWLRERLARRRSLGQ
jgi:hypothetical protein